MKLNAKQIQERADACRVLDILPRFDHVEPECERLVTRHGLDASTAPVLAKNLIHTYTKVLERDYPEMLASSGKVLPIETIPSWAQKYEQFEIEGVTAAYWIDDDGQTMPSSTVKLHRDEGYVAEMGHSFSLNWFDLERAAQQPGLSLPTIKPALAREAHERWTNWVWLFGSPEKKLFGLLNHPNIPSTLASLNAGATSRLPADKSNAEILADVATLIDAIPEATLEKRHAAEVFFPPSFIRLCRSREYSTPNGGTVSLWERIVDIYKGDDSGQGKVTFRMMNECDGTRRTDPWNGGDTSGLNGDVWLAKPANDVEIGCFIRARPYTQRPPEQHGFSMKHDTHSRIGGAKIQEPLAFHVMRFAVGS